MPSTRSRPCRRRARSATTRTPTRAAIWSTRAGPTQYQQDFETESQDLARLSVTSIFRYDAALASAVTAYRADHAHVEFGGFFGVEFRNITFAGERAAAQQTLYAYQVYEKYDRHLRSLARGGDLSGAIAFDTSSAPGNSNWAFYRYDPP